MAKLAQSGGMLPLIQPFAALYVLILATFAPILAKESDRIYTFFGKFLRRRQKVEDDDLGEAGVT